ncbi:eukaryotic translation initiation factor 4E-1A-like [Ctenocephalides felis]|uniref:eukaryotic translation initiation factor 4E-1A-like n=1 Tax=Ctenocephalides felis TaxID=7515 RepID=UPI000E6E463B|nr:eukaryotic translation initiation factor 4E-1A-like [Ctenocephalides felis]XP_026474626.1 eukaryotic translation initiation factor 4E-1A-like [Ctenocephalides felis]XP_026474706.1 eukaryotic translation initiation factor 4E-1A-like [Ctenocephalides felis]
MDNNNPQKNHLDYFNALASYRTRSSVFENQPVMFKHALVRPWTLWHYQKGVDTNYSLHQVPVVTFDTVEDFWTCHNHVKLAHDLGNGCAFGIFKPGIRPVWEDPANIRGGKWAIHLDVAQRDMDLHETWLNTVLCMVGEIFDYSLYICGASVNLSENGDTVALWTADADHSPSIVAIGRTLKQQLAIAPGNYIGYQTHNNAKLKHTIVSPRYAYLI